MESINRATSKEVVQLALKAVADYSGDVEQFTFTHFHTYHKKLFLRSIKNYVNKLPCSDDLGNLLDTEYFDIDLNQGAIDSWANVGACIDYIVEQHYRVVGNRKKIQMS